MERKPYQRYEDSFKLNVLRYYYSHGSDRKATLLAYGIDHSCLRDWLNRYGCEEKVLSLLKRIEADMVKKYEVLPADRKSAEEAYERLQRELELEKLRSAAYSKMIDLAEEEFKLPIRKKSGAKQ